MDTKVLFLFICGARPPSLLSSGYRGLFVPEQSSRGVKLITPLLLLPGVKKSWN